MRYFELKPRVTRRINQHFNVRATMRTLSRYAYAEVRLMEAQAGWIPSIPQAELKIELAYQLYEDACHVQSIYERLPEVGEFGNPFLFSGDRFMHFCNELTNTKDLVERLVGVFWVLRPHLAHTYNEHLKHADQVADNPTVRLLERALVDHDEFIAWGDELLAQIIAEPRQRRKAESWFDHLRALLEWSGGVTREFIPQGQGVPLRNDSPGERFILQPPSRDERFRVEPYERHEGRAATDVWDDDTLLKYMFMMVEGEIEATEACARTLYDFPEAPWELRFSIARQLWDEARHAELSMQRFAEMGGRLDMLPVRDSFPLYFGPVKNRDLARRLAHLNQVVEGWVTDDFAMMVDICRGLGDERTAHLFEYLIADEWMHIKIGADWIPRLTANNPSYRAEVIAYRAQAEDELYTGLKVAAKEVAEKRRQKPIFTQVVARKV